MDAFVTGAAPAGRRALLLAGIVLVALNLRAGLAGVGPLVGDMREATGLSNTALGFLTTLPLIAFGVVSAFTPVVSRRLGVDRSLALALALIGAGALTRSVAPVILLFAGTLALGTGIALGNVLLPVLVKRDFPHRASSMTSLYSSAMGVGAMLAAGLSVPFARMIGWRGSLAIWGLPAGIALLVWLLHVSRRGRSRDEWRSGARTRRPLGRSVLAWQVAAYMGIQSFTFYVVLAWLPELLQSRGMGPAAAGWMLALSQATGIAGSAIIPLLGGRVQDHRRIVWGLGLVEAVALVGLGVGRLAPLDILWVSLLGFVLGGTFALSLLFLVVRAADAETSAELSGMAQSVGYLIAAAGPATFGLLIDVTGGWTLPVALLVFALLTKMTVGLRAARPGQVQLAGAHIQYPD